MKRFAMLGLFAIVLIAGCENPYAKYYRPITEGVAAQSEMRGAPSVGDPKLVVGSNPVEDAKGMLREGNIPIGVSVFNAAEVDDNLALAQAKKVNAEVVLVCKKYTETYSGNTPVTIPGTTSSVAAVSAGGASASSTTTASRTVYVPYNIRRYDYEATYWVRMNTHALGILVRDLTPEERTANGSNKGAVVSIVVRESPAFRDDVLEGDLIKAVDGQEVLDAKQAAELTKAHPDRDVTLSIRRGGADIVKKIQRDDGTRTTGG